MRTRGAVLRRPGAPMMIEPLGLAPPRPREVCVRIMATGLCHSDLHVIDGDMAITSETPVVRYEEKRKE